MAETAKAITTLEIGVETPFSIPISVKKIRATPDVSLDQAGPNDRPIFTAKFEYDGEADPLEADDIRKGVFRSKPKKSDKATWGDFVEISVDDLDVIEDATRIENFTVEHFIPLKDVPFERVTDAYFLAPVEGMSAKPLVLLAKALKRTKRAGVFKFVKSSRQYLAVVYEKNGGLIVNTMAWSGDFAAVREAGEALDRQGVKIAAREVEMASSLIEALGSDADVIDKFEDDLIPLKADLVERALKGQRLPAKRSRKKIETTADDGLEARLRASVEGSASKRTVPVAG